ncbi:MULTISPECIES: hypothetical protein [unclassified Pseudoxanthomonas]|uniref:hypothetical protein n=1 Tax=unclassified Pseudoxanthomonas TaxID=2645906 RepID=UPI0008EE484B|nr:MULTISPECIES: hypothetical protein [unclassified Pseudoxanthomonas]PPJ43190.1 hypothetical protein C0063_08230 [Pseudoxanthomonas sp. KAs_5_3]SFV34425.1 hypothetical protein SAMN05428990_2719 [Pseudoxanthomonas sp. YR558]
MKKLIATPMVLWLAACTPSTPEPARAPVAAAPTAASADTSSPAPAAVPATQVAAVVDDPSAVNQSIDEVLGDHVRYETVIRQLQQSVAARDAPAVAALVDYPFTTVRDGEPLKVADAEAFVREYDRIVTPAIADAITKQKYSQLMVNYKGVMFGNGEAWVNGICRDNACKDVDVRVVALQPGT